MLANEFLTTFGIVGEDFGWIPKGTKLADFEQKAWALAHGFHWRPSVSAGGRFKLRETHPMCLQMDFQLLSGLLAKILGEFPRVQNRPIQLSKKARAIAHGVQDGGFG